MVDAQRCAASRPWGGNAAVVWSCARRCVCWVGSCGELRELRRARDERHAIRLRAVHPCARWVLPVRARVAEPAPLADLRLAARTTRTRRPPPARAIRSTRARRRSSPGAACRCRQRPRRSTRRYRPGVRTPAHPKLNRLPGKFLREVACDCSDAEREGPEVHWVCGRGSERIADRDTPRPRKQSPAQLDFRTRNPQHGVIYRGNCERSLVFADDRVVLLPGGRFVAGV